MNFKTFVLFHSSDRFLLSVRFASTRLIYCPKLSWHEICPETRRIVFEGRFNWKPPARKLAPLPFAFCDNEGSIGKEQRFLTNFIRSEIKTSPEAVPDWVRPTERRATNFLFLRARKVAWWMKILGRDATFSDCLHLISWVARYSGGVAGSWYQSEAALWI